MNGKIPPLSCIAMFCIGAVLLAGCTIPAEKPLPTPVPTPLPEQGELPVFDLAAGGRTFNISLNEEFQLRLPENPTTGYMWILSVPDGLSITNETYIPDDPSGKLVGSGGTHVWNLKAVKPGRQAISGENRRPWEPAGSGAGSFALILLVSDSPCGGSTCPVPQAPPGFHVYTEADSGKQVTESLGEAFGIRLAENPTTGYSWNLSLPEGLRLTGDDHIPPSTGIPLAGAGGIRSFTLEASARGDRAVTAEYVRPWMKRGTVTHLDLEGGFYGIVGDDGKKYDPLALDPAFRKDGLRVAFDATEAKDATGIHMWGTMVNLVDIEEIRSFVLTVTVV